MKTLVDVVNFNADASCLPSKRWLEVLKGGKKSVFYQWLKLFVDHDKKVVLGFPGATVADMAVHNPESINFINKHPHVFEIILRPFAHDISLLRLEDGFAANFSYGRQVIRKEFKNISDYYLPPEFMLTNTQIFWLRENNVKAIFINPVRFSKRIRSRIPSVPYMVKSLFGKSIKCVPFHGDLSFTYLDALHKYDCSQWNREILAAKDDTVFTWRDGESMLFVPQGLEREAFWLKNEAKTIKRQHTKNLKLDFMSNDRLGKNFYRWYPVHSFTAWMKEFRMLGFVNRIGRIEESLHKLTEPQKHLWLMVINSDILSAIEKQEPVVQIRRKPSSKSIEDWTIHRSERGYEGEEYLALLKSAIDKGNLVTYVSSSREAHMLKLRGRIDYLSKLKPSSR